MEKVIIETEIKTSNSVSEFKNLRSQIKDLKNQQAAAAMSFGEDSEQVKNYSKQIGNLVELQEDLNRSTKAFTPDKLEKAQFVLSGVASGFQAATGAAAIFGDQGEDVQKTLLKVQGAMALTAGIKDMMDLSKTYGIFSKDTISAVIKSLTTLRGALIATGVGAAAVAVGLLIANWEEVVKIVRTFLGLGPSLKEQLEAQTKAYEEQSAAIEYNQKLQGIYISQLTGRDKQRAEVANQTTQAIIEAGQKEQEQRQKLLEKRIADEITQDKYLEELEKARQQRIQIQQEIAQAGEVSQRELQKQFAKEDADRAKAKADKEMQDQQNLINWKLNAEKNWYAEKKKLYESDEYNQTDKYEREKNRINDAQKKFNDDVEKRKKLNQQIADDDEKLANIKQKNQQDTISVFSSTLSALSSLSEQGTETQKTFAIASTIIDTISGAQAAFTSAAKVPVIGFILAPLAAAAATLAGYARVKQIQSIKVGSPSIPGASNGGNVPISAPRLPLGQQVQGAGDVQVNSKGEPTKVYVLEYDIRKSAQRVDVINSNSTIK